MILLNDFYSIESLDKQNEKIYATLVIDKNHKIFDGHFPGQPVVPGVCMMQIIKELMETVLKQPVSLHKAQDMKFLTVIDPRKNNVILAEFTYTSADEGIQVNALLKGEAQVYFKFKGLFVQV